MNRSSLLVVLLAFGAVACDQPATSNQVSIAAERPAVVDFAFDHIVHQPTIASESGKPPVLLLLHGYGSNERDLDSFAEHLDGRFLIISVRAPHEIRKEGYAWYNLTWENGKVTGYDEEQANQSLLAVTHYVDDVVAAFGADPDRVFMAGFSQGAILSASLAMRDPNKLAGIVAMSGRLGDPEEALAAPAGFGKVAMLVTHGTGDTVIPVEQGRDLAKAFRAFSADVTYKEYDMAHSISEECFADVRAWLTDQLNQLR